MNDFAKLDAQHADYPLAFVAANEAPAAPELSPRERWAMNRSEERRAQWLAARRAVKADRFLRRARLAAMLASVRADVVASPAWQAMVKRDALLRAI